MGSMGLACLPTWVVDLEENVNWIYLSHDLFGVRNALRKFVLNFFTRHFPQLSARNVSIHGCVSKLHAPSTLHTNYEDTSQRVCTNPEISRYFFSFRSCIPGVVPAVTLLIPDRWRSPNLWKCHKRSSQKGHQLPSHLWFRSSRGQKGFFQKRLVILEGNLFVNGGQ